jgi:hypothetical protein
MQIPPLGLQLADAAHSSGDNSRHGFCDFLSLNPCISEKSIFPVLGITFLGASGLLDVDEEFLLDNGGGGGGGGDAVADGIGGADGTLEAEAEASFLA